jgi:hypothetical protein
MYFRNFIHFFFVQVNQSLQKCPRIVKGKNVISKVGRGWFERFINRHPELTIRSCAMISEAGFQVQESDLKSYHDHVRLKFEEDGDSDILFNDDGSRMWTLDEIGFCLNSKTSKIYSNYKHMNLNMFDIQYGSGKIFNRKKSIQKIQFGLKDIRTFK